MQSFTFYNDSLVFFIEIPTITATAEIQNIP